MDYRSNLKPKQKTFGFLSIATIVTNYIKPSFGLLSLKNPSQKLPISVKVWATALFVYHCIFSEAAIRAMVLMKSINTGRLSLNSGDSFMWTTAGITITTGIYLVYFIYLYTIPKFRELYRMIEEYDTMFGITTINRKNWTIVTLVLLHSFWWIEAILNLNAVYTVQNVLYSHPPSWNQYISTSLSYSWINNPTVYRHLVGFHLFVCQLGAAFAVQSIIFSINQLIERMELIKVNMQNVSSGTSLEELTEQMLYLVRKLYPCLKSTVNLPLLVLTISVSISITLQVFVTNTYTKLIGTNYYYLFFTIFAYSIISVSKLISLTLSGELLEQRSKELRDTIIETTIKNQNSMVDWYSRKKLEHLQYIGKLVKFQLSGYGFFKLNNSCANAILGAIITYNIVLLQFQNDFT